jgi:hypothetical protein
MIPEYMIVPVREEVKVAAKWWADQLCQSPNHDAGDLGINTVSLFAASKLPPLDPIQIAQFEEFLQQEIEQYLLASCSWNPDRPLFGSYHRVVATDYGPDPILGEALKAANIQAPSLRLPIKTVMWIDPGKVSVASGYRAKEVILYQENCGKED